MAANNGDTPVYILIGGAGGIGTALAHRLNHRGASLVLAGRSPEPLEQLARSLECEHQTCEAADFDAVKSLVDGVMEQHGRLDGIVNLAGSIVLKPAHSTSPEEFDEAMDQNVRTAFATVRAAARPIQKSGGGSIVLMSSCAAEIGLMNHELIAAAKAAVTGMARAAAATYAGGGVRVNAVAPGLVDSPMSQKIVGSDAGRKASEALHPLGRLGEPDDIAPVIDWLLGPESAWVTGQTVGVDGGLAGIKGKG